MTEKNKQKEKKSDQNKEIIPPLDFSSLVLPFYTQALFKLDQIKDSQKQKQSLELVKRLIDLLELLKQRTKGNLKPQEDKTLNNCLHHLRMSYMQKSNLIKL